MKKTLKYLALILLLAIIAFRFTLYRKLDLVSGFSAKSVASHYFLANRSQQFTEKTDNDIESMNLAKTIVNEQEKSVSSSVFGLKHRKSIYKEGIGAVLLPQGIDEQKDYKIPLRNRVVKDLVFPYGNLAQKDTVFTNIDYKILDKAINNAFTNDVEIKKTRSILVIYKNKIIAER